MVWDDRCPAEEGKIIVGRRKIVSIAKCEKIMGKASLEVAFDGASDTWVPQIIAQK